MHVAGQQGFPMLFNLPGFSYADLNKPDIAHNLSCVWLMFVRIIVGVDPLHDRRHRAECELRNVFPTIWLRNRGAQAPLPWRLSGENLDAVDARVCSLVYPHHCVTVGNIHRSFWKDSTCAWKMSQRIFAMLIIMSTCLRGYIPALHTAVC